jgi:NTP pyrophosphatase (non-canonical NTP hydrolase)
MRTPHAEMVKDLAKDPKQINTEMTSSSAGLIHMVMGISGETGELLDAVKKHVIYQKALDYDNVIEELGDIEFYLEGLRQMLSVTREETLIANIAKLGKRYPGFEYSNQAAQTRADKA